MKLGATGEYPHGSLMTERERLVADLIREHVGIGYSFLPDGSIDPESLFLAPEGAAYVIVHALTSAEGDK